MDELCDLALRAVRVGGSPSRTSRAARGVPEASGRMVKRRARPPLQRADAVRTGTVRRAASPCSRPKRLSRRPTSWCRRWPGPAFTPATPRAVADMARYRAAQQVPANSTGSTLPTASPCCKASAQPVPDDLIATAHGARRSLATPAGRHAGGRDRRRGLARVAARLPRDARDVALNDAWFYSASTDSLPATRPARPRRSAGRRQRHPGAAIYRSPCMKWPVSRRRTPTSPPACCGAGRRRWRDGEVPRRRRARQPGRAVRTGHRQFLGMGATQDLAKQGGSRRSPPGRATPAPLI